MMGFSRPLPQPPGKPLLKNPSFSSSSSSSSTSSSATTTATSTTSATATGTATSSSPATNAEATVTKTKKVGGVQPFPSQWSVRRFFMGKRRWRKPVKKKTTGRVTSDTFLWLCYSSSSGKGKKIEICGKDLVVPVTVVVGGGKMPPRPPSTFNQPLPRDLHPLFFKGVLEEEEEEEGA